MEKSAAEINRALYEDRNEEKNIYKAKPGISEKLIKEISRQKGEPDWMLEKRLKAFEYYKKKPIPKWGPDLSKLNLDSITYFLRPDAKENATKWEDVPKDIKNTFEKLGIPEAEKKALAGTGAQYECLSGDTNIFTNPKGPVKIKNIKVGDCVFAFDEKENKVKKAKVIGLKEKGKNQLFEVVIDNKKIKATENHPFLTLVHYKKEGARRGRYKREWRSLKDLKEGDLVAIAKILPTKGKSIFLKHPKIKKEIILRNQFGTTYKLDISNNYNKVSLPKKTTDDLMWFFGLYMGDGYIKREKGKDKGRVFIAIPKFQQELRKELKKIVKKLFGYNIKSEKKYMVAINSTIIADFIEINGFMGNSHQKRVPYWVFKLPKDQRLEFLAGYTDSDGYATDKRKANMLIFRSVNKKLIEDLRNLVIYCDLHPSNIHLVKSKHPFDKKRIMISYQIENSGDLKQIKSRYPFKALRLNAKKLFRSFNTAKNTDFRKHTNEYIGYARIKSIRLFGVETVYDIEVKNYHNFIAEGLIVHNSSVVYHKLKEEWEKLGVVFLDMDEAVRQHPELVKKYFMTKCVPINDHKFISLHGAVWSGGTFIYIPKGVKVSMPLQAYFRMNAQSGGQFEHTLIIADEGSEVFYVEGCSAPRYIQSSLHAGCVEIYVGEGARVRYSSVENWSKNTYNLNTKRAIVEKDGIIEWVGGNMGSGCTMLYPCSILKGEGARADHISLAVAGKGQNQDTGAKVIHLAKNTASTIKSKGISTNGGITSYRGLVKIIKGAEGSKCYVQCDALLMDEISKSNTFPTMQVMEEKVDVAHEATVGKISEEQLFYLMSRGISAEEALKMIVVGFMEPIIKELPLEYAVEMNRLIELELEGSIG